jgi:acetyltransferase
MARCNTGRCVETTGTSYDRYRSAARRIRAVTAMTCMHQPSAPDHFERFDASSSIGPFDIQGGAVHVCLIRAAMTSTYRAFVDKLSVISRFNRFHFIGHPIHDSLIKHLTDVDQISHVALAAFVDQLPEPMIAEARYIIDERFHAEWAVVVADEWQRKGIGHRLSSILLRYAQSHHVVRAWGLVQRENRSMRSMARRLGFSQRYYPRDSRLLLVERAL